MSFNIEIIIFNLEGVLSSLFYTTMVLWSPAIFVSILWKMHEDKG